VEKIRRLIKSEDWSEHIYYFIVFYISRNILTWTNPKKGLIEKKARVVNDIGGRDISLSKNVERHHCLRHIEMSSDIFKNVDKNVDVENVEIFKRSKFNYLSTKNSFDCTGTFYMLQIIYFSNIMLYIRHIFNDTCVMY
jgi:hypothetical protein